MSPGHTTIPLCRSPFLQELTIALGRRSLKSLRQNHPTLRFDVSHEDVNGVTHERLNVEARDQLGKITRIILWEDAAFWVYSRVRVAKSSPHSAFELRGTLTKMNAEDSAELLRATLRDFESVLNVWKNHAISP